MKKVHIDKAGNVLSNETNKPYYCPVQFKMQIVFCNKYCMWFGLREYEYDGKKVIEISCKGAPLGELAGQPEAKNDNHNKS